MEGRLSLFALQYNIHHNAACCVCVCVQQIKSHSVLENQIQYILMCEVSFLSREVIRLMCFTLVFFFKLMVDLHRLSAVCIKLTQRTQTNKYVLTMVSVINGSLCHTDVLNFKFH